MPTCPRCGIAIIKGESHDCGTDEKLLTVGRKVAKVFREVVLWLVLLALAAMYLWWVMSGFRN